jgi:hypothetical protein
MFQENQGFKPVSNAAIALSHLLKTSNPHAQKFFFKDV